MKVNYRVWEWRKVIMVVLLLMPVLSGCGKMAAIPEMEGKSEEDTVIASESMQETESAEQAFIPKEYMITSDNYFDYQPGLECSAFSSAYLLRHYGEEADGLKLYENFPSRLSSGGAMPSGIVESFKAGGYEAEFKSNGTVEELKELVSRGNPVIVFIHVEEPYESPHNTHYIPLVGYDEEYFYFAESLSDYANCKEEKNLPYNRRTEIDKFERLWTDIDATWDNPYFLIEKTK